MQVIEEFETIRTIIRNRASISRYGDGEFQICRGGTCHGERYPSPELRKRLCQILKSNVKNMLIGIPRADGRYDLEKYDPETADMWLRYQKKALKAGLLDPKKMYYSAFISRPDSAFHIDCDIYWDLCKQIWEDRKIVLVQNDTGKNFNKAVARGFFSNAKKIDVVLAPVDNAWAEQKRIYNDITKTFDKNHVILLALGPTATVLAFDLHAEGYQALDLGHWPMFAARTFTKGYK